MKIELVFETTCPNAEGARRLLKDVGSELGVELTITEINKDAANAPEYAKRMSSPTILVEGKDAVPDGGQGGNACRIYRTPDGRMTGLPPREAVKQAIELAQRHGKWGLLSFLPLVGAAFLPVASCPACWPFYASLLASMGISFVDYTPYLAPVVAACASMAVLAVGFYWKRTGKWIPAAFGLMGVAMIVIGKLAMSSSVPLYVGAGLAAVALGLATLSGRRKSGVVDCAKC